MAVPSYSAICATGTSRVTIRDSPFPLVNHYAGPDHCAWRAPAQLKKHRRGNTPQQPDGDYGAERVGEIVAGVRYHLCGRAAAVRGDAFDVRAAIPRSDGEAGWGFDRRDEPCG